MASQMVPAAISVPVGRALSSNSWFLLCQTHRDMQKSTQKSSVCCCQEIATSALLAISSILRTRPLHYQIPLHAKIYRYGRSLSREPFFEAHQKQKEPHDPMWPVRFVCLHSRDAPVRRFEDEYLREV